MSTSSLSFKRLVVSVLLIVGLAALSILTQHHSPAQAQDGQNLPWGEPALGQVTSPEGALFNFEASAGDTAEIEVLGIGGFTPSVSIQDAGRNVLAEETNAGQQNTVSLSYTILSDGFYYIQVTGTDGSVGQFTITLNQGLPPGIPLLQDTPAEGIIGPTLPEIYYDFSTNPDENTRIEVRSTTEGYSPMVTVLDSSGETVAMFTSTGLIGVSLEFGPGEEDYKLVIALGEFTEQAGFEVVQNLATPEDDTDSTTPPPASQASPTLPPTTSNCVITGDAAVINVRSGGSTDHEVVGTLEAGVQATAVGYNEANGGWYQIQLPDGVVGWVSTTVVSASGDCADVPTTTYPPPSTGPQETEEPGDGPTATATPTGTTGDETEEPEGTEEPGGPTNTATPTPSYTPTTPPAPQIAPEDTRSNSPLNIDLDTTASVLEFVSYPGGDTEDRISYSVRRMNPNVAFSGGRARLTIQATCFGEGTEYIEFFTGGQTYSCGDTVVDREVTFDSNSGTITITATGGSSTYVQWVLTGTATRIN